jgi:hypothetical protein
MKTLKDYLGRDVRLTDERLQHILGHPEMAGLQAALEETLRQPETVIQSRTDPNAALHYRHYTGTKVGDKWLCVVVKYGDKDAFVLTAYLTDKPKRGMKLWPSK